MTMSLQGSVFPLTPDEKYLFFRREKNIFPPQRNALNLQRQINEK